VKRVVMMVCLAACALASTASAATNSVATGGSIPSGNSAISQFTEPIPNGGGSTPAAKIPAAPTTSDNRLPALAPRALRGSGAARRELTRFVDATAPGTQGSATHRISPLPSAANAAGSSVLGSVVHSLDGSGGMGLALPVILILLACGFGAATAVLLRRS
jgi:hypothetical protein